MWSAILCQMLFPQRPMVLVHVMPWFESKPVSGAWGWHWTMGKTDPDAGQIAAHYRPSIGAYDSGDPLAIDCQLQLMKLAGVDGILVDWYGDVDLHDYKVLHQNTEKLFAATAKVGLKFGLVYEDATLNELIKAGRITPDSALKETQALFKRQASWFKAPHYVRLGGKPLLMVFGPQYFKDQDWRGLTDATVLTLHNRASGAAGAFDWPLPKGGAAAARQQSVEFLARAAGWLQFATVAYPRFHDYYQEAGVHDSWGRVEDLDGKTFQLTLARAMNSGAPIVQIATWNDWGEGTMIEPSKEFGTRDLRHLQSVLGSEHAPEDLDLPIELYKMRQKDPDNMFLKQASQYLSKGEPWQARSLMRAAQ